MIIFQNTGKYLFNCYQPPVADYNRRILCTIAKVAPAIFNV
ncbi:hypothetical protein FHW36_11362 [Chitinophaga polysaccharea]|uniref:Uncharacterized protein n=1 Tax=Chitinophaga polysaccharea TaxID=1293035 RepID=A0A561P3Y0_9BACT|nr:hypothetical protein FHW36_11362 [Chitinophaga polysaccharea]